MLLVHSRHNINEEDLDIRLFVPFKDLIILGTAYFIAIKYRHNIHLHARAMIATGIVFIEPALVRFIMNTLGASLTAYLFTIGIIYALLIALMIAERRQKKGRWIFPLILVLYMLVHSVIIFNIHIGIWKAFCKWFIVLPLT
jgi:Ca2+/Na+ antiporter